MSLFTYFSKKTDENGTTEIIRATGIGAVYYQIKDLIKGK